MYKVTSEIHVICIAYDYGVVTEAGAYTARHVAQHWIDSEVERRRKQWLEIAPDEEPVIPEFYIATLTVCDRYGPSNGPPCETCHGTGRDVGMTHNQMCPDCGT